MRYSRRASEALVIAAQLYDIGHLLGFAADDIWLGDARHEVSGARWLAARLALC